MQSVFNDDNDNNDNNSSYEGSVKESVIDVNKEECPPVSPRSSAVTHLTGVITAIRTART